MKEAEERLVEVKLLGELGRKFGRSYKFWVRNPRDVISALSRQLDGFKDYLCNAHENGVGFKLITRDAEGIDYEHLTMECERLVIAPVISGSGTIGRILIGVALVALAFIPGVGTATAAAIAAGTAKAGLTAVGSVLFSIGASLIFTGLAALLTPPVQTPRTDGDKKDSFLFDRAAELTTQGYPVPVLYGEFLANAPLVVSSSISTEQIPV